MRFRRMNILECFIIVFVVLALGSPSPGWASMTQDELRRAGLQGEAGQAGNGTAAPSATGAAGAPVPDSGLNKAALKTFQTQLRLLQEEKDALTPVQKKINAAIVRTLHATVLKDRKKSLPQLEDDIALSADNMLLVDIKADVDDGLLRFIEACGGTVVNAYPQYQAIRARIPITQVETIAAQAGVRFIDKAQGYILHKQNASEGDVAHKAPTVRGLGYNGSGVKVGVLSDSVDHLADVQATGDLPSNVTVLQDDPGNSGEGTAMLEIVYDLAPGAALYFATADMGMAGFANNIIALKDAGCKVIVDDVGYFAESPFQDDVISQAVNTVTDAGVLYFSSAANDGNLHSSHSGTYEGDFTDDGQGLHLFSPTSNGDKILQNPGAITLQWSDPLGASSNDYDLYVMDSSGGIIAKSDNAQTGDSDPYEQINVGYAGKNYVGYYVVVVKYSGSTRFLHLGAIRGVLNYATDGATKGHSTADKAFGVAAVSASNKTAAFAGTESVETYSSDGPRRVFYNPDGSAITPGDLLHTGGTVRQKPDITAADCVKTATPDFNPFCGTSAAAPHAAAIAAQLLSAKPGATMADIRSALTTTALPTPATWTDYGGKGIIMADAALNALGVGQTGSLTVTILPAGAVSAGAQWNVDGGAWRASGATATGLSAGSHVVAFKEVAGWTKPANQTVTVVANQTATASGVYAAVVLNGILAVNITPTAAVDAGASFCLSVGGNSVCKSSGTVTIAAGTYNGWFTDVTGWTKPGDRTVTITADQTTTVSGTYSQVVTTGSLTVNLLPSQAVIAGGQWRLDGGAWRDSGFTLEGLAAGAHTVSFKPVSSWTTPGDQAVNIVANTLATVTGTYVAQAAAKGDYVLNAQAPYAWEDDSDATILSQVGDDSKAYPIQLGFGFTLYGQKYASAYVSTKGFLSFTEQSSNSNNVQLPNSLAPKALVAPWWDDLIVATGGAVSWKRVGTSPNAKLIVTWRKMRHFGSSTFAGDAAFQIVLYENSGVIKMQYQNTDMATWSQGAGATVGIQDADGTRGLQYGCNAAVLNAGQALTFTPGNAPLPGNVFLLLQGEGTGPHQ